MEPPMNRATRTRGRPLLRQCAAVAATALLLAHAASASRPEPLVGWPCEGCEAAFDGLPPVVPTHLVLRSEQDQGVPLRVQGRIIDREGSPRGGVLIYLHQTDAAGQYPAMDRADPAGPEARRHGRLRGWVRSDDSGVYRIDTVRPGAYPGLPIPEHIHMQVIVPGCATYLIDDLLFRDDPRLTPRQESQLVRDAGGSGVVEPRRDGEGWHAQRDIHLGRNIPDAPDCAGGVP